MAESAGQLPVHIARASETLTISLPLRFRANDADPFDSRQGKTLGDNNKHWFRAKFFQQYRLFFRYHLEAKIIVYARVNDEENKRAFASKTDAYKVFAKMLKSGNPPDDWEALLKAARDAKLPL